MVETAEYNFPAFHNVAAHQEVRFFNHTPVQEGVIVTIIAGAQRRFIIVACQKFCFARDAATLANPCSVFARIATADSATVAILAGSTHGGSRDARPIVVISKQSVAEKRTGYVNVLIDDADVDAL